MEYTNGFTWHRRILLGHGPQLVPSWLSCVDKEDDSIFDIPAPDIEKIRPLVTPPPARAPREFSSAALDYIAKRYEETSSLAIARELCCTQIRIIHALSMMGIKTNRWSGSCAYQLKKQRKLKNKQAKKTSV